MLELELEVVVEEQRLAVYFVGIEGEDRVDVVGMTCELGDGEDKASYVEGSIQVRRMEGKGDMHWVAG